MGLFTQDQVSQIMKVAEKSREALEPQKSTNKKASSINATLNEMSSKVLEYFKDSKAILITSKQQLHEYIDCCIEAKYVSIDTETTGLDRLKDTIVGWSLYYPGGLECYIPCKHIVPIFNEPYKNQLSYEECREELQRLVDSGCRMILANADYDIAMIYKDLKVDIIPNVYYDVILAWRCLKENELHNGLKELYAKYVLHGKCDPKKFTDFFSPELFPYSKPEVAALYAANDAKITYDLFVWQLPYVTKTHDKCKKARLEKIADLVWNIEIPMIEVCAMMHRNGVYFDSDTSNKLTVRYHSRYNNEVTKLGEMINELLRDCDSITLNKSPFRSGQDFKHGSPVHVKYLCNSIIKFAQPVNDTGKETLTLLNHPVLNQILKVRGASKLLDTYVDKLPKTVAKDKRIHPQFKSIGADTGRMSSQSPNAQNIPSHATDIRHSFRAQPTTDDTVVCQTDTDTLEVNLFHLDTVDTDTCSKQVKDLVAGDKIKLMNNNVLAFGELIDSLTTINEHGEYLLKLKLS